MIQKAKRPLDYEQPFYIIRESTMFLAGQRSRGIPVENCTPIDAPTPIDNLYR